MISPSAAMRASAKEGKPLFPAIVIILLIAAVTFIFIRLQRGISRVLPAGANGAAPQGPQKYCVSCGAPNEADSDFCKKCGMRQP